MCMCATSWITWICGSSLALLNLQRVEKCQHRNRHADPQSSRQKSLQAFYSPWQNIKCMFSLFNIRTKLWKWNYFWVHNAKKWKFGGGKKKPAICVLQGKKEMRFVCELLNCYCFKLFKNIWKMWSWWKQCRLNWLLENWKRCNWGLFVCSLKKQNMCMHLNVTKIELLF